MRSEDVKAAIIRAPACCLGLWFNVDELCIILDINKAGFESLMGQARYISSFATAVGLDFERIQVSKGGPYMAYFYLRRNLQPPTTSMRSAEERSKRPDFELLSREVRRARRDASSAASASAEASSTTYSLRTPVSAPPERAASTGPTICDELPPMIDGPG